MNQPPRHQISLEFGLPSAGRPSLSNEIGYLPLDGELYLASVEEKKRLWWRNACINALFIASWFFFATILSVYNKWMFSEQNLNFPYPLFVSSVHMGVQFCLAATVRAIWPRLFRPTNRPKLADYGKKAAPTAVATGLDIGLSNLSLRFISLSFYTMCKSSSLIFVLAFAFLFRLEVFSWRLVGVISLIFSGVTLMVATETSFVLSGFLLVMSASALGGLRWGLTQLLLKDKELGMDNPAATIYWLSPVMGITLAAISVVVEGWGSLARSEFFESFARGIQTALYLIAPGILAFCMVLSEFYILQRAGMVPMSIAGIAKEVTTISVSAWFFGDELTLLNLLGVGITVCGISLFTYHKYRKSIETGVSLDAHGTVIVTSRPTLDGHPGHQYELEETARLTSRDPVDDPNAGAPSNRNEDVLFWTEDDEDSEEYVERPSSYPKKPS